MSETDKISIVTRLKPRRPSVKSCQNQEVNFLTAISKSNLGPTQPPVKWFSGNQYRTIKQLGLLSYLRMLLRIPPLPHTSSRRRGSLITFYLQFYKDEHSICGQILHLWSLHCGCGNVRYSVLQEFKTGHPPYPAHFPPTFCGCSVQTF